MVAVGGVSVVVTVLFVALLAGGVNPTAADDGDRVGVTAAEGPAGIAVLAPRCRSERVRSVELRPSGGAPLWRITARRGSIDQRYVVGAGELPLDFELEVPFEGTLPPEAELVAEVVFGRRGEDDVVDRTRFRAAALTAGGVFYDAALVEPDDFEAASLARADCPEGRRELGPTTLLFAAGAAAVIVAYAGMFLRWWRGRDGPAG
jgi:hypothetical protein